MPELDSPFRANRSSLKIFRSVLFALFMREMQTRFGARRMGFVWVVMEPLIILVVIVAFHSFVHAAPMQGINFIVFMVSGIVPFHMMRSIIYRLTDALQANQGLFAYRQLMPFDTFVARVIVEICTYSCAYFIICFSLGFWLDYDVSISDPLMWIYALLVGVLLSFSIGAAFAMIAHAIPNSGRICKLAYIPLYITAGVFFPIWNLPAEKMYLISWNPYVEVIDNIRAATFENYPVTRGVNTSYPLYFTVVLTFFVMVVYRRRRQSLRAPIA
ncbi:ABC transporter permease [Burkholderia pseudomultivorans]|uniref:Transport permease protein n=1 Tax=Burkholderia cenocepacia TaxID=95486 RepID=A0AAN0VMX5_9BURK|nr:ABC transporter permease [Burkholderia pseudomultivorans]AIO33346.1 ABC-2 type transporter family protein [Burkholderia cenocepacia]KWF11269.1 ABC transporter [Burkholderia pseudomultivorans]